jgi:hypothetical protein
MVLLFVGGLVCLVAIILWLDNAQGGLTGNGVFKAMEIRDWVVDPGHAPLYPANYFFYPVYGYGCHLLDLLGVFTGDPRRQMTILNAASASVCLTVVYALVRQITGHRLIALACAIFHIACNDVLFLAIVNEDIMSSYTIMFASMALAGLWFARPTVARVVIVSIVFTVGWLFEWRLMFPTLPAMAVALWLCEKNTARRVGWIALFLAVMVLVAALTALLTRHHPHAADTWTLLWTGKAVVSAWSGFAWIKAYFMADGLSAYLFGTRFAGLPGIPGWDIWRVTAIACELAIAAVALTVLWRSRDDARSRSLFAVFGGTLVAGQIFNLYSQPQDPQMQLNVMAWMTVGWALVMVASLRRWGRRGLAATAGLPVLLLAFNVWGLGPQRGLDTNWAQAVARLGERAHPSRTVFVIHDFDWASIYAAASWGNVTPDLDDLEPAPQAMPKFKRLGFVSGVLQHHTRSEPEQVAILRAQIERAIELGYEVVAVRLWDADQYFLDQLSGTVVTRTQMHALTAMLHHDFTATVIMDDPVLGKVYRLQKAPGR